jgi:hypothetical protein
MVALDQRAYWASGLDSKEGPLNLEMALNSSATFIDRDPNASPESVCLDVLAVESHFILSTSDRTLAELEIELYADAPDHFAGFAWLAAESLRGALAEISGGSDVIVDLECTGDGLRFWFSRLRGTERETFGRVVPMP